MLRYISKVSIYKIEDYLKLNENEYVSIKGSQRPKKLSTCDNFEEIKKKFILNDRVQSKISHWIQKYKNAEWKYKDNNDMYFITIQQPFVFAILLIKNKM